VTGEQQDLQQRLGELLQRPRGETDKIKIGAILERGIPVSEKVRLIESLETETGAAPERETPGDTVLARVTAAAPEAEKIHLQNRLYLKRQQQEAGRLEFFFGDFWYVRKFGRNCELLDTGFLGLSLRFKPRLNTYFSQYFQQQIILPLLKYLKPILSAGWLILGKKQYNQIALLQKFCMALSVFPFNRIDFKDKKILERVKPVENLFLVCMSEKNFLSQVTGSLQQVLDNVSPAITVDSRHLAALVRRLLRPDLENPSFYNLLLAINMVHYRRLFRLDDLLSPVEGPLVSSEEFDCSPEVEKNIRDYVLRLEQELLPLLEVQKKIEQTKVFLPSGETGRIDFSPLESFYNSVFGSGSWDKESGRGAYTAIRFVRSWLELGRKLWETPVLLEGDRYLSLFDKTFFASETDRARLALSRLEKGELVMPHFSLERYYALKTSLRGAVSMEVEIVSSMEDLASLFFRWGELLMDLLRYRLPGGAGVAEDPVTRLGFQKRLFSLPGENRKIMEPEFFQEYSVEDSLRIMCQHCLLFSLWLRAGQLSDLLEKEERVKQKIISHTVALRRVATRETFMVLKNTYNLPHIKE
jgi:hypothetical protein